MFNILKELITHLAETLAPLLFFLALIIIKMTLEIFVQNLSY